MLVPLVFPPSTEGSARVTRRHTALPKKRHSVGFYVLCSNCSNQPRKEVRLATGEQASFLPSFLTTEGQKVRRTTVIFPHCCEAVLRKLQRHPQQ